LILQHKSENHFIKTPPQDISFINGHMTKKKKEKKYDQPETPQLHHRPPF